MDAKIFSFTHPTGAGNQNYPSGIAPYDGSYYLFRYPMNGYGAAVAYRGSYRLTYLSYGFEGVGDAGQRLMFMRTVLDWLRKP